MTTHTHNTIQEMQEILEQKNSQIKKNKTQTAQSITGKTKTTVVLFKIRQKQ